MTRRCWLKARIASTLNTISTAYMEFKINIMETKVLKISKLKKLLSENTLKGKKSIYIA